MRRSLLIAVLVLAAGCASPEPRLPVEELRPVPDVVGRTVEVARDSLESDGFIVQVIGVGATPPADEAEAPRDTCAKGKVVEQDPPGDQDVRRATTVVLTASGC